MKIVIDIPEEEYKCLDYYQAINQPIFKAIKNGTPLPDNHGRLIDADVLADGFEDNYEFCEVVNATPTILEAKRGE